MPVDNLGQGENGHPIRQPLVQHDPSLSDADAETLSGKAFSPTPVLERLKPSGIIHAQGVTQSVTHSRVIQWLRPDY
jgi:hypothetical protein